MGRSVETRRCDNPVREHYEVGRAVGVTGTPAIVLESGENRTGVRSPPEDLAQMLDERVSG